MAGEGAFQVEGVIIDVLPGKLYRAELSNGHKVLAFTTGKLKKSAFVLAPGDKVTLLLSPFDLSRGRIAAETKND